jgi:hypothetical protein
VREEEEEEEEEEAYRGITIILLFVPKSLRSVVYTP